MIELLKYMHVTAVAVSFTLFFIRGIWIFRDASVMHQRWVKIVPHAVDTVLLGSAIALAWLYSLSPLDTPWLLAKIIALLVYIGLGLVAIDIGHDRRLRLTTWLAALAVFGYIVAVALTKSVLPWQAI